MFDKIKELLSNGSLDGIMLNPEQGFDSALAVVVMLVKVACVDGEFDSSELTQIAETLKLDLGLTDEEVGELVSISEQVVNENVDTDQLILNVRDSFNLDQKQLVACMMWKVLMADGKVSDLESIMIRELTKLIGLSSEQAVRARLLAEVK